jgi:hypothetical protein
MRFVRVEIGRSQLKSPQIPAADDPLPENTETPETMITQYSREIYTLPSTI